MIESLLMEPERSLKAAVPEAVHCRRRSFERTRAAVNPCSLILVVGAKRSGKSMFAEMLEKHIQRCSHVEADDVLIGCLARVQREMYGSRESVEDWERYIRDNKTRYRGALFELREILTDANPEYILTRALSRMPEGNRGPVIVAGCRRRAEVHGCKAFIVLVTRKSVSHVKDETFDQAYFESVADVTVGNDGTIESLDGVARRVARMVSPRHGTHRHVRL